MFPSDSMCRAWMQVHLTLVVILFGVLLRTNVGAFTTPRLPVGRSPRVLRHENPVSDTTSTDLDSYLPDVSDPNDNQRYNDNERNTDKNSNINSNSMMEELDFLEDLTQLDEDELTQEETRMKLALDTALDAGGEYAAKAAYPQPTVGAVLVTKSGKVLGKAVSDYRHDAVVKCIQDAGIQATALSEWHVSWPDRQLRQDIDQATLYMTLEPLDERHGTRTPPITELINQTGIRRVVIGCPHPVPESATKGATALHNMGIRVSMGSVLLDECQQLIEVYSQLANSKLMRMARKHFEQFRRPLGFLHCSVVDSDNLEAFARQGNAFGSTFGGKTLSFRDFGSYEIAPPPEVVWASDDEDGEEEYGDILSVDFEEEEYQEKIGGMMMPWYEQVDAVVATFPKQGNGPSDDDSVTARLNGLKWLATHGAELPPGVERIIVMDSADLRELPLTNNDPNLPSGVDIEAFWAAVGRKPSRVLLRRAENQRARATAELAAECARLAAECAKEACVAIEKAQVAEFADRALEYQRQAEQAQQDVMEELQSVIALERKLESMGVLVETLEGGDPIDVMKHLGERDGYKSVVWRAGCWGERGVQAILAGAFQWVSAHLAVDAVGGRFWQLMLAENAVQAACGPERKVKVFADQEDLSLEYCDVPDADSDCVLKFKGRAVRHIRLDCRVALFDETRPREFRPAKTRRMDHAIMAEEAPWFL